MNQDCEFDSYFLQKQGSKHSLSALENWFSNLSNSSGQVGFIANKDFLPFSAMAKVILILRKIVENEGLFVRRSFLTEIADWHASHLSYVFKKNVGIPLKQYINKIRFCSALRKIAVTEKQVKQIAHEAGYSDPLYFGKVFKRYFGISPDIFRRKYSVSNPTYTPYDRIKTD